MQDFFLHVRGQVDQVHELADASSRHVAQHSQFGLTCNDAFVNELVQVQANGQGHEAGDARHSAQVHSKQIIGPVRVSRHFRSFEIDKPNFDSTDDRSLPVANSCGPHGRFRLSKGTVADEWLWEIVGACMNADPIYDADDSSNSKGRLREIAAIFAAGILRLRGPAGPVAATSDKSFEVIEKPLEESG